MNCPHCGRTSESTDKFCAYCGKSLAPQRKFCSQCGAELRADSRFCAQCGHPQTPEATPGRTAATPAPAPTATAEAPSTAPVAAAAPPPTATAAPKPAPRPAPAPPIKIPSLDKIREMFKQGAKEQARDLLAEYVKGKAKDAGAWTTLGEFYRELEQNELAEGAYQTALKLDRKQTQAYIGLGILARRREEYGKALDYYLEALKLDPRSGHAWSSAAVVAIKLGQDAQAVEFAEKGWELEKGDPAIAANLSIAYHYAGRIKDRDRMYEQAKRMKYGTVDNLDKIFSGELTVRA